MTPLKTPSHHVTFLISVVSGALTHSPQISAYCQTASSAELIFRHSELSVPVQLCWYSSHQTEQQVYNNYIVLAAHTGI